MTLATKHVLEAFWAARAARNTEAATHLRQAIWPPKSPQEGTYALDPNLREAAFAAYSELAAKHLRKATVLLERALYPGGIPASELIIRKMR